MNNLQIVEFTSKYASAFKDLNEAWIKKFFELEEEDVKALNNPNKIIDDGGYIFVALLDGKEVGVCALRKIDNDTFEFSKMAVDEGVQGLGIGKNLGETAIQKARSVGAKRVYLEGNTRLEASIHLYRKLGFEEFDWETSSYKRVNIMMEKIFKD